MSRDNWQTPDWVFEALDSEFHFNLDGAATSENTKVQWTPMQVNYLGVGGVVDDAFDFEANATDRIYVNPPYSCLGPWVDLFAKWGEQGATVVALLLNNTDTAWFRRVWETADEIRFLDNRIQFIAPEGVKSSSNNRGSIIAIWRGHSTAKGNPRVSLVRPGEAIMSDSPFDWEHVVRNFLEDLWMLESHIREHQKFEGCDETADTIAHARPLFSSVLDREYNSKDWNKAWDYVRDNIADWWC